jgi:hypothetical protein
MGRMPAWLEGDSILIFFTVQRALPQSSPFSRNENGEDACMDRRDSILIFFTVQRALPQSSPFSKNENGEDACMGYSILIF